MKKVIVSYSSNYGHTKKYAEYIAEKLNCPIVKFEGTRIKDYNDYDIIIYCAPIKNNMIWNCYKFTYNFDLLNPDTKLFVFADGMLPPSRELLEGIVRENFYREDAEKVKFFYGEGGLDISKITWTDTLHLRYYIEQGLKAKPGERYYELAKIIGEAFDHTDMAYADKLIAEVRKTLDE